ncbi:Six-hairpin glycosidase-like protein [Aspergillus karnatakaensis]|uniref:Six-hairpin glycosidase-like protein n=1 Tax=Aspergillus karnatakaensis TaxID=1810916 RepID=UPI003CCE0FF1
MSYPLPTLRTLSVLCLCVTHLVNPIQGTDINTRPYSARMADSVIFRRQAIHNDQSDSSGLLQVGVFQTALLDLIRSPSAQYLEQDWELYLSGSADSIVAVVDNATRNTQFPLDRLSLGKGLSYQYDKSGNGAYKESLNALWESINLQPRNEFGGLWYYVYPNWSYLDGMFSLLSFVPLYTSAFPTKDNSAITSDLFHQLNLLWSHCHDNATNLLVHGYDASLSAPWVNSLTGGSPHVWIRALGWFMMGLVDFLELSQLDSTFNGRDQTATWRSRFNDLANALIRVVDPDSGAWWQLLDEPGKEGNYIESSGSAMFVYALLKGARVGLLEESEYDGTITRYTDVAERAYQTLVERFVVQNEDGTLSYNGTVGVCSLNSTATYGYYVHQPLVYDSVLGSAAFIRASIEYELYAAQTATET